MYLHFKMDDLYLFILLIHNFYRFCVTKSLLNSLRDIKHN